MTSPTAQPPTLTCPKCQGAMRPYERNGVTIDQCADCRGIFLDRGELEALLGAVEAYEASPRTWQPESRSVGGGHGGGGHGGGHGSDDYGQRGKKRRGGFLGGFFDD
ncbi:MAG: zf-TFIIB domain-containing protein [Chloroflexi bacterium]|nr:zf-TFIIB domain-containing protein [Chloroflexota bacterium]